MWCRVLAPVDPMYFPNGEYASDEGMSFAFSFHPRSQSPRKRSNFLTQNWRWARIGVAGGLYVLNGVVQCRCAVVHGFGVGRYYLALDFLRWRWICLHWRWALALDLGFGVAGGPPMPIIGVGDPLGR